MNVERARSFAGSGVIISPSIISKLDAKNFAIPLESSGSIAYS
jgi:hypothetical protein